MNYYDIWQSGLGENVTLFVWLTLFIDAEQISELILIVWFDYLVWLILNEKTYKCWHIKSNC